MDQVPAERRPGRGATANPTGRHEAFAREAFDDGWGPGEARPPLRTVVTEERPRSALNPVRSPDLPFDRSVNPYRGCEHGCVYCFARPSHADLGLSPGLDFETRLVARPEAPAVLARELAAKGYAPRPVAIGTNTDPYQPIERERRIMRGLLEVLSDFGHPVMVTTKGALIERDVDLLGAMAARGLAQVAVSVPTLDRAVSRAMDPRAPAPERRLLAVRRLAEAGVPVRVLVAPIVPGLTDHEVEAIVAAAAAAGARGVGWSVLRLPREVAPLFRAWLAEAFPGRAARVMAGVRALHGGRDYDATFGTRLRGQGEVARLLAARVALARRRHGLDAPLPPLRCDLFAVPGRATQLNLFGD